MLFDRDIVTIKTRCGISNALTISEINMYYTVYAPDGERFEVPHHKFTELVLNSNWTQTPPEPVEEPKEEKQPKRARKTKRTLFSANVDSPK